MWMPDKNRVLCSFSMSYRKLETAACVFIRDEVDGKPISSDELDILQGGENFLHTRGSFHTSELEVLLRICEELPNCYVRHEKKVVVDFEKLGKIFIDSRFHNEKLLGKFVSVAGHLKDNQPIWDLLKLHHELAPNADQWKISPLLPGGVWKLVAKDRLAFMKMVTDGTITSEQKSRKYLLLYEQRRHACVSFCF